MKNNYKANEIVSAYITGIENYGIFVKLDDYYSGLIHISEISDSFVRNINDYVSIGETIKAKILEIDYKKHHVKLSIKNIDYRIDKRKRRKILETSNGFSTLKFKLNEWILQKENEKQIFKKNKY